MPLRATTSRLPRRTSALISLSAAAGLAVTALAAPAGAAVTGQTGSLTCSSVDLAHLTAPDGAVLRDRPTYALSDMAAQQRDLRSRIAAMKVKPDLNKRVDIPVAFHVITEDDTPAGGNVPRTMIRAQMKVLNHAYRGKTDDVAPESARTPFHFHLKSVDRTRNADWFRHPDEKANELAMKKALKVGGYETLNIYTVDLYDVGLLGFAYLPYHPAGVKDGVVMETQSMPGGTAKPYDEGDTATHEVGHFLGLYHTFDHGCNKRGDFVPDTPFEKEPSFHCSELGRDSCPQPGLDPIQNFMDYPEDSCMNQFTRGQRKQMILAWYAYRAG